MAEINTSELVKKMLKAAQGALKNQWPAAKDYAESEFRKLGETFLFIQKEVAAGRMTEERARLHMKMQKNATRMMLLTLEGLGVLAVEAAINAALSVVKETVNGALDFALL
jgi:hypothetical protein